jgi:hypothetical protein
LLYLDLVDGKVWVYMYLCICTLMTGVSDFEPRRRE